MLVVLSGYELITRDFDMHPYTLILLSGLLLTLGVEGFQEKRKVFSFFCALAFIFTLAVLTRLIMS
ncbi:DUF3953 domain-containing protein [Chengkuizengella sp. SCS-71B]|uniref:DUF3953 domain-containing protein n=1 Tax=Chengkuizengella sp. SCS-71B TaxID=3115290 RepID=UPI0032C21A45